MEQRKLGKNTTQRMALIKGQASQLLWHGKIETTYHRAREVSRYVDKLLNAAFLTYTDTYSKIEERRNAKGVLVKVEMINDGPKKLAARRKLMAKLDDLQEVRPENEPYEAFIARTGKVQHPLIEKIFNEYAPRIASRNEANGASCRGGYTRVIKTGARRGDAAETAIIELTF